MKQCLQCHHVFPDEGQIFCGRDGSPLVELSQVAGGFASLPISPSEIVLLFGEQFAGHTGSLVIEVPLSGALVDAQHLAVMILTAAVLACEQAGSIRLEASRCVLISAGAIKNVRWQEFSLEDRLCRIVGQGTNLQLPPIIAGLWQKTFRRQLGEAWIHARTLVLQGLATRKLISAAPDFSSVGVDPALATLPPEETIEPLKNLFSEVATQRPAIWAGVQRDVALGVQQRAKRGGLVIDL
jgi:hypothetical protein